MNKIIENVLTITLLLILAAWLGCGDGGEEAVEETGLPEVQIGVNLVKNPSFEMWDGFVPVGWELVQIAGEGERPNMFGKSTEIKKSGNAAYFLRGLYNTDKWMVLVQRFPVRPGYDLHFSAEIKHVNIKRNKGQEDNANIFIRFYDKDGERVNDRYYADKWTKRRLGTGDWSRSAEKVAVPKKARTAEVGLINQMTGHLYFDDVVVMLQEGTEWKKKETEYITFYYLEGHPFPEGAIDEETRMADFIVDLTKVRVGGKIKYYFYPSPERFMQIMGSKKYKQRPIWAKKELHTIAPVEQHAMIHMLLADEGYPPVGLAKGLVFALRGKYVDWDPHLLAKRFLQQKMIPALFKIVEEDALQNTEWAVTIPAWASFCKYLIDKHGMRAFMNFYRECDGVTDPGIFNDVFAKYYGKEFKVIDRLWRLFLLRIQTEVPVDSMNLLLPPVPTFGVEVVDSL